MRLEELAIGNWVRDKNTGEIGKVLNIGALVIAKRKSIITVVTPEGEDDVVLEDIEGVEITPKILEKNGWEGFHRWKNMKGILIDVYYQHFNKGIIDILFKDNSIEVYCEDVLDIFITSIHQLQNALTLMGINKEIVI